MRSEIADKILKDTPDKVTEQVSLYASIMAAPLTEEERKQAEQDFKLKKFFHERNKAYWEAKEKKS